MEREIYVLTKEDKVLFKGTSNECYSKLLDIQPNSCYYATNIDDYKVKPKKK